MKRSVKKAKSKNWKAPSKRYRQVSMQQMIRDDIAELRALITKLLRNVKLN
jgi:hypothetical protein